MKAFFTRTSHTDGMPVDRVTLVRSQTDQIFSKTVGPHRSSHNGWGADIWKCCQLGTMDNSWNGLATGLVPPPRNHHHHHPSPIKEEHLEWLSYHTTIWFFLRMKNALVNREIYTGRLGSAHNHSASSQILLMVFPVENLWFSIF